MFTISKGSQLSVEIIESAIAYNEQERKRYDKLERYYRGQHDILSRFKPPTAKNTRVVINHASYIVDTAVGYLFGNPVEYQIEEGYQLDKIQEQFKIQTISDLDHELAKDVAIFGKQYELVYTVENEVKSTDIDVRNCVCVYDDTVEHKKMFGIMYRKSSEKDKKYDDIVVYDEVSEYQCVDALGKVVIGEGKPHQFGSVPIIEYRNNSEEMGDFEQVISLIDAYNLLQSDRINDKEQLVEAILVGYGVNLEPNQMEELQINRTMFGLPPKGEADVEYLTKSLDEEQIDVLRKTLETDIHKIAKVPNMSDENFSGNSSGVAIRYKLLSFELNTMNKERYFEKGLIERVKIYNNYLASISEMKKIPAYKVDVIFKRNMPQNELETSQMILNLTGLVDDQTLVGLLPFISDAGKVVEKNRIEEKNKMSAESPMFGTTIANQVGTTKTKESNLSNDKEDANN